MRAMFSAVKPKRTRFLKTPETSFSRITDGVVKAANIIVAGLDITTWPIVVINVPAGPLGILLDGSCTEAAILDDFAPVAREGTPGAVEASGKVHFGSVLVGMDTFDFMQQPRKTLAEIGKVLREAAHLKRQLHFRVPPQNDATVNQMMKSSLDNDKSYLFVGLTSSATNLLENESGVKSGEESSTMLSGGLRTPTTVTTSIQDESITESRVKLPIQKCFEGTISKACFGSKILGRSTPFVRVTEIGSPVAESDKHRHVSNAIDQTSQVEVSHESIGTKFDNSTVDRAVMVGLPDGFNGMPERSGSLSSGAGDVEIKGKEVSRESSQGIRGRLGRLSGEFRNLSFGLPSPIELTVQPVTLIPTTPAAPATRRISAVSIQRMSLVKAILPTYTENLELRRHLELKLVMTYDRRELKSKEFWFAVHADWMNRWALFVGKEGLEPGPITNHKLLAPDFIPGTDFNQAVPIRLDIEVMRDFRFVTPMVYSLLAALHGPGDAPPIARFSLDINSDAPEDVNEVLLEAKGQAKGLATSLREKCQIAKLSDMTKD